MSFGHDVTKVNLSGESNSTLDVIMWPKFGGWSISMKDIVISN